MFFEYRLKSVVHEQSQIVRLETENRGVFEARLSRLHLPYAIGREARAKSGQSLAGRRDILPGAHQSVPRSPYGPDGKQLPFIIRKDAVVPTEEGDGHVQSYCFRICLSHDPTNRLSLGILWGSRDCRTIRPTSIVAARFQRMRPR